MVTRMGPFDKKNPAPNPGVNPPKVDNARPLEPLSVPAHANGNVSLHKQNGPVFTGESLKKHPVTKMAILLGSIASMGGFVFGYESGQISGEREPTLLIFLSNAEARFPRNVRLPRAFRRE